MEIGIDPKAAFRTSVLINTENNANASNRITGLRKGRDIFLPPSSGINAIGTYCHEVGHVIGDYMSFQAGLPGETGAEVLSIDDVKKKGCTITISMDEDLYLRGVFMSGKVGPVTKEAISIANKLLKKYTKDSFNPDFINFHAVDQQELEELSRSANVRTISVGIDGNIVAVNSKAGRDDEIPAFTAQLCCWQILENTLKMDGILNTNGKITAAISKSPSHQRAKNIIGRGFQGKGWRPPSRKDINAKQTARAR